MKYKLLFWGLATVVLGSMACIGWFFYKENPLIFWLSEATAFLAIFFFIILYRQLVKPYKTLQSGLDLLKAQDFASRLRYVNNKEANNLIDIFNKMIGRLKEERLSVREKNRFLDLLIQDSPQGLMILDFDEHITDINPAGLKLLGLKELSAVKGKKLIDADFDIAAELASLEYNKDIVVRTPDQSIYRCLRSTFPDRGFNHPFILIEELTDEMRKIEKESYGSIIRMMSHEVNNSVGAIGSTLNIVSETLRQDNNPEWKDILPAVEASYDRCINLAQFTSNFAEVIKIPDPVFAHISLNELARSADALTRFECNKRNIDLTITLTPENPSVMVDGIQFEQVLVNIIKNAYEAIGNGGKITIATSVNPVSITIEDNGPGIPKELQGKLFTPFFTTKTSGQGIGLMLVKEVLNNHRYKFFLSSDGQKGTAFKILLE